MIQVGTQALTNIVEGYFVGRIGVEALAGVSLVFPLIVLMQTLAGGAFAGAVSSSIGRAYGAGRRSDAEALVVHAVLIALGIGVLSTLLVLYFGPVLYWELGGRGVTLRSALTYSNIVFCASPLLWLANIMNGITRATGNMIVPALATVASSVVLVVLSPCLIFGLGPFPQLGIAGAGIAVTVYYLLSVIIVGVFLVSGSSEIRLRLSGIPIRWTYSTDMLRVGAVSALVPIQNGFSALVITGLIGTFGTVVLAGYGIAARLEFLIMRIMWSLGSTIIAMVAISIGAGQIRRARRVAWLAATVGMVLTGTIGATATAVPEGWIGLFSHDTSVLAAGARYLGVVGPFYCFIGLGTSLFFVSQGADKMMWPSIGNLFRLVVSVSGGWGVVVVLGRDQEALYVVVAASMALYGFVSACGILRPANGFAVRSCD